MIQIPITLNVMLGECSIEIKDSLRFLRADALGLK